MFITSKTPEKTSQFKWQAIQYKRINIRSPFEHQKRYQIFQRIFILTKIIEIETFLSPITPRRSAVK